MERETNVYEVIQQEVNKMIDNHGMEKVLEILKGLTEQNIDKSDNKLNLYKEYLLDAINRTIPILSKDFLESRSAICTEAKMIIYTVLKRHLKLSYSQIAKLFGQSKRSVQYHCTKCKHWLSMSKFYEFFESNYRRVESQFLLFKCKVIKL